MMGATQGDSRDHGQPAAAVAVADSGDRTAGAEWRGYIGREQQNIESTTPRGHDCSRAAEAEQQQSVVGCRTVGGRHGGSEEVRSTTLAQSILSSSTRQAVFEDHQFL